MQRTERGLSESIQYAVVWPVLLLVTLGIIQAGIFLHGRNVAQRAAASAVDVARGSYGTTAEAEQRASAIALAGGLDRVNVRVSRSATRVSVEVSGTAPLVFDIGVGRIRETADAPRERVTQP